MKTEVKVKTLGKSMSILECFIGRNSELGIAEISRMMNLPKSNVHDIISTFEQLGYICQNPNTGKYHLSVKLLEYSYVINEYYKYPRLAYDLIDYLSEKVQQIVFFAVPQELDVFYLHSAYPCKGVKGFPYRDIAGEKCPMYCSALGKAMLAFGKPSLMKQMEKVKRIQFTPHTILTHDALCSEIDQIRRLGFSVDKQEHEYNAGAVAVPILNTHDELIGAASIYSTCETIEKNMSFYVNCLKEMAFKIRERS